MGIRCAFNPLGTLPESLAVAYSTVSWTVSNLSGLDSASYYPSAWTLSDGSSTASVSSSNCSFVTSGSSVVFTCEIPEGWKTVTSVAVNDTNYTVS